ncbi:phosphatidylinositol-glycan biosynthesis class X protein isoform X3 [Melospiza georgiana]|uniref:phosphatidylinositol-glycan biosynthesis class X protein isoform X3 n=1 Tax=Melospiza georgiana TaxID=44398 RepID=UPI0025ACEBA5|nr:phosphatidylinositol-glycan biosynthesis class X protein isoform X3 [Melospiza georgiana]
MRRSWVIKLFQPLWSLCLHCWFCVTVDVQAACRVTSVTQELLKEGFHRDLLVKVELGEDAGGCAVAAQVHLPSGIYVDPYELATLQQHNLTKAVLSPAAIDVEAPEYLAQAAVLLLFLEPESRCSRCFRGTVPVHARYHRPARGTHQAWVPLQSPQVLLCCCHGQLSAQCWEPAEVDTPCSSDTNSSCQWHTTKHRPGSQDKGRDENLDSMYQADLLFYDIYYIKRK